MKTLLVFGFLLVASPVFASNNSDAILGQWLTAEGKSKVEIYRCGNLFCGKIVWLKEPTYPANDERGMAGKEKVDRENTNSSLRTRPLMGLEMLNGFSFVGDNKWENGKIYDPKNGKTYSCVITKVNENQLDVRGYVGISLIGRSTSWTRAQ